MPKGTGILAGKTSRDLELLKRHVDMLRFVADNGPIGIIKLAELMGLPQHKVRYSLRLLEAEGLIRASTSGARITARVPAFLKALRERLEEMDSSLRDVRDSVDRMEAVLDV